MLLVATVDKSRGNAGVAIVERFFKFRASTMFSHPKYSMDGTGMSIAVSCPHEEVFNSSFGVWLGLKKFSDI